ncbi:MAG TPA: SGNH/GDSL hydrolase family protein [Bryobacterales bacterium]|nr:SGNH/GDSL hydrolase family protein [Bryobacterales bacterium]
MAALLAASLYAIARLTLYRYHISLFVFWSVRLALLGSSFLLASAALYFAVIRNSPQTGFFRKTLVVLYSLYLCFVVLETALMFIPRSQTVLYSLAGETWLEYYWKPINQYGYRDRPVDLNELQSKTAIIALGDSFTAGHGIESIRDRYSDLLQAKLPPRYRVLNLGKNGSDTEDEYQRLLEFPVRPRILILQYFGNDISEVIPDNQQKNLEFHPYENLPHRMALLFAGFYILNYIYWEIPEPDLAVHTTTLLMAYGEPQTLERHYKDLYRFVDFSRANQCPLVVVIFPFLEDLETSKRFTVPIEHFFAGAGTPVLDVANLVAGVPVKQRVINSNDHHASKLVHRLVAGALYKTLVERGWVAARR